MDQNPPDGEKELLSCTADLVLPPSAFLNATGNFQATTQLSQPWIGKADSAVFVRAEVADLAQAMEFTSDSDGEKPYGEGDIDFRCEAG